MYVLSKLFGCNLFHLPTDRYSTEPIHMKAIDYVIALLYVVLYVVLVFPFFIEMVFVRTGILLSSGNFVIIYLVRIIFYFIIIANCSCYIMETLNRNKIWKLLSRLNEFDEQVGWIHFSFSKHNFSRRKRFHKIHFFYRQKVWASKYWTRIRRSSFMLLE